MSNPIRAAGLVVQEGIRSRLWPVPTLGIVVAVLLGLLIPRLDVRFDQRLPDWLDGVIFGGDAGAARTVLDAVSSSLITVTALTFSLTVVTLQLASSQFSPRLLRTFTKDLFVQVTLALFLATFTFSLTVLRSVRSGQEGSTPFVPRIAVTISFLLAIASVIALVLFLAHLTRQIRVETMLANVHQDATETASSTLPHLDDPEPPTPPQPTLNVVRVHAEHSGFLVRVDEGKLVDSARARDAFVRIDRLPGSFIVAETPVVSAWRYDGAEFSDDERTALQRSVRRALHVGPERTGTHDVAHGLRQLVDVAAKALSPGINDPTTAIHALDHVSALLAELTRYRLGSITAIDRNGISRLECVGPTFGDHLDLAITQPLLYGRGDPLVVMRLLEILRDLAWTIPSQHSDVIRGQLHRIEHAILDEEFDSVERQQHHESASGVQRILTERFGSESAG